MEGSLNEFISIGTFPLSHCSRIAHDSPIQLNCTHANFGREIFRRVGDKEKSGVEEHLSQEEMRYGLQTTVHNLTSYELCNEV